MTQDKNTGKAKPLEQKGSATKNQNTNISMVKEASPNENKQKHKAIKDAKGNKSPVDSSESVTPTPIPTSAKRNCSERSPLEGNPQKRQCETTAPCSIIETTHQTSSTQLLQIEEQAEGTIDTPARCYKKLEKEEEKENNQHTHNSESNQNSLMQTILHELKSIKETIHLLGEKVDTSCENTVKHTSENTELKKINNITK